MKTALIDLIRHGEPQGGRRYRGQLDDPLSELGWQQMWRAVGEYHGWQHIFTSPLVRCRAFAELLGARHGIPVVADPRLKECGFGAWEGLLPAEICAEDSQRLFNFRRDPLMYAAPGAEPLATFYTRVQAAWDEIVNASQGKQVLVVAHAGVIRMVLASVLGLSLTHAYRLNVGNAALTRIRVEWEDGAMLSTLMFHDGNLQECS
jgi:alpha-ribazole phosphatase/probable phosphoglycerate mutase